MKKTIYNIGITLITKMAMALVMLFASNQTYAQWADKMSNPTVTVQLTHPPSIGIKVSKIAFGESSGKCSDQIVDELINAFVNSQVEVIDRNHLETILNEHNLRVSSYVDKASAAEIGKIIGPSMMIFIKTQRCEPKNEKYYKNEKKYNYQTKSSYVATNFFNKTQYFLKATVQAVDLSTARIFSAQTFEASPAEINASYDGYPIEPDAFMLHEKAIQSIVYDIKKMFLPWTEASKLIFFDDKTGNLQIAFQALKRNDLQETLNQSVKNLTECKKMPGIKDKTLAHAYYNVGMSHMILNENDTALLYFREAAKLRPGEVVDKAIADCQKAITLQASMQQIDDKIIAQEQAKEDEEYTKMQDEMRNMLSNKSVIEMKNQKLPDGIVIQKIKTSKCSFDLSTDGLIELNDAGISEAVIVEMMAK